MNEMNNTKEYRNMIYSRINRKGCVVALLRFSTIGFFLSLFVISCLSVYGEDVRIGRTSMKISSGSSIVFKNDVSVFTDAIIANDGNVFFKNKNETTIDVNTILNGNGIYYINGNADCFITGEGGAVSSLSIKSGKRLRVTNNFSITNNLYLESGIVDVADDASLRILNTSIDAIEFNDNINNRSFIEGALYRNVIPDVSYTFPLGTTYSGYRPMVIQNVSSSGCVGVNYLDGFAGEWNLKEVDNASVVEDIGGWRVDTDAEEVSFSPLLPLFTSSGIVSGDYNIFFMQNITAAPYRFSLNYNSKIVDGGIYLSSDTTRYKSGIFAVNENQEIEKENSEVTEFVNFIVADGSRRSRFEVPGINNYKKVILKVYDRSGNLVYKNDYYTNDFETRNYRPGTYFYELVLVTNVGQEVLVRDFIEVMRRD